MTLLNSLRAHLGNLLIYLSKVAAGYGYYLVFRYGTEAQVTKHLDAAVKHRAENTRVVLVRAVPPGPPPHLTTDNTKDPYAN